jgi:hypothetical protein
MILYFGLVVIMTSTCNCSRSDANLELFESSSIHTPTDRKSVRAIGFGDRNCDPPTTLSIRITFPSKISIQGGRFQLCSVSNLNSAYVRFEYFGNANHFG